MTEKLISELPIAVALTNSDVFIIEQESEVESTKLSVEALLAHINNTLVVPLDDELTLSIGNVSVNLQGVDDRLVIAEGDIDTLQAALDAEVELRDGQYDGITLSINTLEASVSALEDDLSAEVLARQEITDEVTAARGGFSDLDARLDDLAVNAGKVSSVFGREGVITAETGDYTPEQVGAAPAVHEHDAADITSGVLVIERGGTNGEGFRYIESDTVPTGEPIGTRWLDTTSGREYTLTSAGWVQWSGGQPIQGMEGDGSTSWGAISGVIADQTDLQAALDAKAASDHSHSIDDVTGLQDELDAISTEFDGVATELNNKADIDGQVFTGAITAPNVLDTNGNVRKLLPVTANATTTLDTTHLNKVVEKTNNTAYNYTISPSLGVQGDVITVINSGTAGDITIVRGTGVALYRNGTDANITVGPGSMTTIYRSGTANRWVG